MGSVVANAVPSLLTGGVGNVVGGIVGNIGQGIAGGIGGIFKSARKALGKIFGRKRRRRRYQCPPRPPCCSQRTNNYNINVNVFQNPLGALRAFQGLHQNMLRQLSPMLERFAGRAVAQPAGQPSGTQAAPAGGRYGHLDQLDKDVKGLMEKSKTGELSPSEKLELQEKMQKLKEMMELMSTIIRMQADMMKTAVQNIR